MTSLNYSIAPSDMAFHALTTSLYKDRLRAPVREILSNAIDIQRRTGNETPIEIKLPTPLDAQFRIRDFGSGLSKEDMARLYSSLFSSDKHLTRTNEVGGFGVGAKSPFAYTDAFTVESFHNGTRTIYSAFMDGNRAPQLLALFSDDTLEPNGLAVSYPVVKSDEELLRSIVRQEVAICGHPVECIGITDPVVRLEDNPKFEKVANVWLGYDSALVNNKNDRDTHAHARMGNVLYPIRKNAAYPSDLTAAMRVMRFLTSERDRRDYFTESNDRQRARWDTTIFELPIGSVRPAMSREELVANDDLTIEGLRQAYATALQALYRRTIDTGDGHEREQLFELHEMLFLGAKESSMRQHRMRHRFLGMHDDYEDERHYGYDRNDKKNSAAQPSAEDAQRKHDWLRSEYQELAASVKEQRAQAKIWMETSLAIHPGLLRELQSPMLSKRFRHSSKKNGEHDFFMVMEGFMPLEELQDRRGMGDVWSDARSQLMLVRFDPNHSKWATDFLHHQDAGPFRKHYESNTKPKFSKSSFEDFSTHPNTLALMQTLAESSKGIDPFSRKDYVLMLATSEGHEKELLALADKMERSLFVLDLANAQVLERQAATPGDPASDSRNPYATASVQDYATKEFKAYYWDSIKKEGVTTKLKQLPEYWLAGYDEDEYERRPWNQIAQKWQEQVGTESNAVFHIVPPTHPAVIANGDLLSPAWRLLANTLTAPEHTPATRLDWLLASSPLPQEHPLHNEQAVKYVQCHGLLQDIQRNHASREGHRSWERHEDTKPLKLAAFKVFETFPTLDTAVPTSPLQEAIIKRYPLLSQLSSDVFDSIQSKKKHPSPFPAAHGQAIAQYVALVDKVHPEMPSALLPKSAELPIDAQSGPTM